MTQEDSDRILEAARTVLALCQAIDRGDVTGLASLVEDKGEPPSWLRALVDDEHRPEEGVIVSTRPFGVEPGARDALPGASEPDPWGDVAEQAVYLLWEALKGLSELLDRPVEELCEAWIAHLVADEARGAGHHSVIVATLQHRLETEGGDGPATGTDP